MVTLAVLFAAAVVIVLVAAAVALAAFAAAVGWIVWELLPFRHHPVISKSPEQRLTDQYVTGKLDIGEFERRVSRVLARRSARNP